MTGDNPSGNPRSQPQFPEDLFCGVFTGVTPSVWSVTQNAPSLFSAAKDNGLKGRILGRVQWN
jgi:hypothetical protein